MYTIKNTGKADQCKNPRNCFISLSKSEAYSYRRYEEQKHLGADKLVTTQILEA